MLLTARKTLSGATKTSYYLLTHSWGRRRKETPTAEIFRRTSCRLLVGSPPACWQLYI